MQTDPDPSRYVPRHRESAWSRVSARLMDALEGSNLVWVAKA
jgi:hypothetical protein